MQSPAVAVRYRNQAARAANVAYLKQVACDQVWLAVLSGRPPMVRPGTSVAAGLTRARSTSAGWRSVGSPSPNHDPSRTRHRCVIMAEHHQPSWVIVKLIGLLIALLILPVLIMLNLLLYLVILPAAVQAIFG